MEGIALGKPPLVPKVVMLSSHAANPSESSSSLVIAAVAGGVLLLYCLSRLIALQRRVRDIESRPPVDDIVMRGMIRQEVTAMFKSTQQELPKVHKGPLGMNSFRPVKLETKPETKVEEEIKPELKPEAKVEPVAEAVEVKVEDAKLPDFKEFVEFPSSVDAVEIKEPNASKKKLKKKTIKL